MQTNQLIEMRWKINSLGEMAVPKIELISRKFQECCEIHKKSGFELNTNISISVKAGLAPSARLHVEFYDYKGRCRPRNGLFLPMA